MANLAIDRTSNALAAAERLPLRVVFGVILATAALAMLPSFVLGPPAGDSLPTNLAWLHSFDTAVWRGELYPRWLKETWGGVGSADFYFYAPLPFWVSSIAGRVICPPCGTDSLLNVGSFVLLAVSGLGFWLFARRFVADRWAVLAGVVYMIMPYHLGVDWYVRQALGEFAAYAFVPFIAHALRRLHEEKTGGLGLALGVAGLSLSHLPSLVIWAFAFAAVALWLAAARSASRREGVAFAVRASAWAGAGLVLAMAYWLPAIVLISDVSPAELQRTNYHWYKWLILDGKPEPDPLFSLKMKMILLSGTIAVLLGARFMRSENSRALSWALLLTATVWVFMTPASWFFWSHIPPLQTIQFPWRFLQVLDFAAPLPLVWLSMRMARLLRRAARPGTPSPIAAGRLAVLLVLIAHLPFLSRAVASAQWQSNPTLRAAIEKRVDYRKTVWEYLPPHGHAAFDRIVGYDHNPVRRKVPGGLDAIPTVRVSNGQAKVRVEAVSSRKWRVQVESADGATVILKQLYWKHWRASDVGRGTSIGLRPEPTVGLIQFRVPNGRSEIEITIPLHWSERAGFGATAAMALLLIALVLRLFSKFTAPARTPPGRPTPVFSGRSALRQAQEGCGPAPIRRKSNEI